MKGSDETDFVRQSLEIFDGAIALPECKRLEYIRERCGNNEALLKNCCSLLEKDCSDESFFGDLSGLEAARKKEREEDELSLVGERYGVYQLNKKLGSGGMADVYAATRTDGVHSHPVALKLVRGWGDTTELVSRFQRERKILSGLKHPNIAHFLDGGVSEEGRPYYAMEYVEGEHFDKYCQQNALSLDECLRLFINVCEAVASAHQQLVIHRDLKPGNILVTEQGQVKLLDFGIAKIMDDEDVETNLSALGIPMTPRYSSPEQVKRETLTTASDQYSLGVLLYELLTGQPPYDLKSGNLLKAVCETQPKRPSQAVLLDESRKHHPGRKLSGDLDAIVLKALQKAPERRYASVKQFAEDIERYLRKQPVIARRDTVLYLSTRFIQRHLTIVIIVLTLLVVVFGQQIRVMNERDVAQKERALAIKKGEIAKQVQEFMISLFEISDPGEARGNSIKAREILDRGVEKIEDGLNDQPEEKSALLHTMGAVYRKLGLYETSAPLLKQALVLRQEFLPAGSVEEAESLKEYGDLLREQGRFQEAEELHKKALIIYIGALGEDHPSVAATYHNLGIVYWNKGEYDRAIEYYEKALPITINALSEDHPSVANTYNNLGLVYWNKGEYDRAIEYYEKALPITINKLGADHPSMADTYHNLGIVYRKKGEYDRAIEYYEKALFITINALGDDHPSVGLTYNNLGVVYMHKGIYDKAIECYRKALSITINALEEDHPSVADTYHNLGVVYRKKGEYDRAIEYFEKDLSIIINALGEDHPSVADTYDNLGIVYDKKGEYDQAIEYFDKSISILSVVVESNHPLYAEVYANLGDLYTTLSEYPRALSYYQKALPINMEKFGAYHPDTIKVEASLAKLKALMANAD